jgi:hypothetical protein
MQHQDSGDVLQRPHGDQGNVYNRQHTTNNAATTCFVKPEISTRTACCMPEHPVASSPTSATILQSWDGANLLQTSTVLIIRLLQGLR